MSAQKSFCSVSLDGIAHFFAGNKSNLVVWGFFVEEDKPRRMPSLVCFTIDSIERFGITYTVKLFYTAYVLYRQSFSAFCSSGIDYFSTVFSLHSCSKTVCSFSWRVVWLECSFHC